MPEEINWRSDWPAALNEAKTANLPLVLEIYLEGCPVCARLARETHTDPGVVKALNERFIPVRLEARKHLDLALAHDPGGHGLGGFICAVTSYVAVILDRWLA